MTATFDTSKRFAHGLLTAVDAEMLTYRDYISWADAVIAALERPPAWVCELSVTKYRPDAIAVLRGVQNSEPFQSFDDTRELYLGFLWLRYDRRELSWATFLAEAARYVDGREGSADCEFFYQHLNHYEESGFDHATETIQRAEIEEVLTKAIRLSEDFVREFRKKCRTTI